MEQKHITQIPANKLVLDPALNMRVVSPGKAADKELIANIEANGVLQNLVVVPTEKKGVYAVVAGGRRYSATDYLIHQKKLPKSFVLPCLVKSVEDAMEISLSENFCRANVHAADEILAMANLAEAGKSQKEIANHFGQSLGHVRKRLRLASVAPELIQQYRAGKLNLDDMTAFTLSQDHAKQIECFESFKGRVSAWAVRRYLTEGSVRSSESVVKFITLKAYKRRGGAVSSDLFEDSTYLLDSELIASLADEKLEAEADSVAKEGWKWVEITRDGPYSFSEFHRIEAKPVNVPKKLQAKIDSVETELNRQRDADVEWTDEVEERYVALEDEAEALDNQLDQYRAFSEEEKTDAGAIITFDRAGELCVVRGLVRTGDRKVVTTADGRSETTEPDSKISGALNRDLASFRQQAVQAALVKRAMVAGDLLAFTFCSPVVSDLPCYESRTVAISSERTRYPEGKGFEETSAATVLQEARSRLSTEWAGLETQAQRYHAFCALAPKAKALLVAYAVAQNLSAAPVADTDSATAILVNQLEVDVASYWRPTKDNYFKRVKGRDALLEIGQEWFGDSWAQENATEKKSVLASRLHEAVNNPSTRESINAEKLTRIDAWLPEEIRD